MDRFFVIRNEATYGYWSKFGFVSLAKATHYASREEAEHVIEHTLDLAHSYLTIIQMYHI
jgi:hypothetical protein